MASMNWDDINRLDIVDFLASLGIHPTRSSGNTYTYFSPLRVERTPSFKVDRKKNRWKDFGTGEGRTLIDFGILYFHCTIGELKDRFNTGGFDGRGAQRLPSYPKSEHPADHPIKLVATFPIRSLYLQRYLWERRIPLDVANTYCVEAQYTFGPKTYYGIGFQNDLGGYELRNKYHKYSIAPKAPTLFSRNAQHLAFFEGFFDMLTFVTFVNIPAEELPDLLVLNSVSGLERALSILDTYPMIHGYLDNDRAGDNATALASMGRTGFIDHRGLYKGYNDLNQWACSIGKIALPGLSEFQGHQPNPNTP